MKVLYLDGNEAAPKGVPAALQRLGVEVVHLQGGTPDPDGFHACVVGDLRADLLQADDAGRLADAVHAGLGLVVLGGPNAFGRGGWASTPLAPTLPARLHAGDDHVTLPSGAFLFPTAPHPVTQGLPFDAPPVVTGFHRVEPTEDARVLIEARPVGYVDGRGARLAGDSTPILLVREHGRGRVATLATGLDTRWSGGWTGWGGRPVALAPDEEVGVAYLRFLGQLLAWAAQAPLPGPVRRSAARA